MGELYSALRMQEQTKRYGNRTSYSGKAGAIRLNQIISRTPRRTFVPPLTAVWSKVRTLACKSGHEYTSTPRS